MSLSQQFNWLFRIVRQLRRKWSWCISRRPNEQGTPSKGSLAISHWNNAHQFSLNQLNWAINWIVSRVWCFGATLQRESRHQCLVTRDDSVLQNWSKFSRYQSGKWGENSKPRPVRSQRCFEWKHLSEKRQRIIKRPKIGEKQSWAEVKWTTIYQMEPRSLTSM